MGLIVSLLFFYKDGFGIKKNPKGWYVIVVEWLVPCDFWYLRSIKDVFLKHSRQRQKQKQRDSSESSSGSIKTNLIPSARDL